MSVLPGEGKVPILFGATRVTAGPRIHDAYLVRPDLAGSWPTIVLYPGGAGASSSVRAFARRIGRQGFAVLVADIGGADPAARLAADIESFVANPVADWSSAEHGYGTIGIGDGGPQAVARTGRVEAIALIGQDRPVEISGMAALSLIGRQDPAAEALDELRAAAPAAQWVVYGDVGAGFHDDAAAGFDHAVATDAVERLAAFFAEHLPAPPT